MEEKKPIIEIYGIKKAKELLDEVIKEGEPFFVQLKKDYPERYFQISSYIDELLCKYPNGNVPKLFAEKLAKKHNVYDIYLKEMFRVLLEKDLGIKSFNTAG